MLERQLPDILADEENGLSPRVGHLIEDIRREWRESENLANFTRTLTLPKEVEYLSLTAAPEKLVKFGAKVVAHGRYVTFQMAEVAVPRALFRGILERID